MTSRTGTSNIGDAAAQEPTAKEIRLVIAASSAGTGRQISAFPAFAKSGMPHPPMRQHIREQGYTKLRVESLP